MAAGTKLTVEQYLALPESGPPWQEYVRGEAVEKPLPNAEHPALAVRIMALLLAYQDRGGGRPGIEGRARFTDPDDARYLLPDLSYYRAGVPYNDGLLLLPPTLVIEIGSPGQSLAYYEERAAYLLDHGTEETWLVDPETRTVRAWDAERDGAVAATGAVDSVSLPGLSVDVDALFRDLLPGIA